MPFSPFVLAKNLPRRRSLHLASAQYRAMQASSSLDLEILPSQQTDTTGIQLLRNQRDPQNQVCKCAHAQALPRGAAAFVVRGKSKHPTTMRLFCTCLVCPTLCARLSPACDPSRLFPSSTAAWLALRWGSQTTLRRVQASGQSALPGGQPSSNIPGRAIRRAQSWSRVRECLAGSLSSYADASTSKASWLPPRRWMVDPSQEYIVAPAARARHNDRNTRY